MDAKHIGPRVKELREERLWTQERLSEIAGVSLRTIQRIEAGHPASPETVIALANAFKVDAVELTKKPEEKTQGCRPPRVHYLPRFRSAQTLASALMGSETHLFDHDAVESPEEATLVGGFLQSLSDWGEIWSDLGPSEKTQAAFSLEEELRALEGAGFAVYARRVPATATVNGQELPVAVAVCFVARRSNLAVARTPAGVEMFATTIPALAPQSCLG